MWSIDIIKENKTHQKNTPYCSILTSKGNHIKDSWGCYVRLLRQSLGNRLFKLPLQISGGVRNGKKWTPKNEVPHRWIQYPLQFITSIFWGVHFSQIVIFGTSGTFCSFCQQDFLSDNSKWLNFPIKFKKKLKIKLCFWTLKKKIADTYNTCMLHRLLTP